MSALLRVCVICNTGGACRVRLNAVPNSVAEVQDLTHAVFVFVLFNNMFFHTKRTFDNSFHNGCKKRIGTRATCITRAICSTHGTRGACVSCVICVTCGT